LAQHAVSVGGPTHLQAVVGDRIAALSESTRQLLVAVAVSAQPIRADVARVAAGLGADDRISLNALRATRLIRGRSGDGDVETYHDRIREAVVAQLSGDELATWHRRLATAWEASGAARPE